MLPFGLADNFTAQLMHDLATNVEAEANPSGVDLLRFLNESIKLEELGHVLLLDACSVVTDREHEHVAVTDVGLEVGLNTVRALRLDEAYFDLNLTVCRREFQCVG